MVVAHDFDHVRQKLIVQGEQNVYSQYFVGYEYITKLWSFPDK